jgi:hypothetical protein
VLGYCGLALLAPLAVIAAVCAAPPIAAAVRAGRQTRESR